MSNTPLVLADSLSEPDLFPQQFYFQPTTANVQSVKICGSFQNWSVPTALEMKRETEHLFSTVVDLPAGIYTYKFIVDGVWQHDQKQQVLADQEGNINNVISVTAPEIQRAPETPDSYRLSKAADNFSFRKRSGTAYKNQLLLTGVTDDTEDSESEADEPPPADKPELLSAKSVEDLSALDSMRSAPTPAHMFGRNKVTRSSRKLLIVMVGLPARGKSFVSKKLRRYLRWLGCEADIFNIGSYRRETLGSFHSHDFFRPDNPAGRAARDALFHAAMDDLTTWLRNTGTVAILDGTNSNKARRKAVVERMSSTVGLDAKVIFLELICNDSAIIESNIQRKAKSPDYVNMPKEQAIADFRARLRHYEAAYEPVEEPTYSFIKLFDVGSQLMTNLVRGYLPCKIVFFLMNMHILQRDIFLCRSGQSMFNIDGIMGGDSSLAPAGHAFHDNLKDFVVEFFRHAENDATPFAFASKDVSDWRAMNDLDHGIADSMKQSDFAEKYPDEAQARDANKLGFRYQRGENYADVIQRLEPVLIEVERTTLPLLIVGHLPVLRCIYGYLNDMTFEELPFIDIPLHTVIHLRPDDVGSHETRHFLGPRVTDGHVIHEAGKK